MRIIPSTCGATSQTHREECVYLSGSCSQVVGGTDTICHLWPGAAGCWQRGKHRCEQLSPSCSLSALPRLNVAGGDERTETM